MHVATAAAFLYLLCLGAPLCGLGRAQGQGEAEVAPDEQRRPTPYSVLGLVGVPGAREPGARGARELPNGQYASVWELRGASGEAQEAGRGAPAGVRRRLREQRRQSLRGRRPSAVVAGLHGSVVDSGYYAVTVYLGSPPQRFTLIADTGSSITYVPCVSCQHCGKQHQDPWFDPSKSSSCQAVGCSSPDCVTRSCTSNSTSRSRSGRRLSLSYSLQAGGGVALGSARGGKEDRLCMYSGTYAESSSTQGVLMADSLSFTREAGDGAAASPSGGPAQQGRKVAAGPALRAAGEGASFQEGRNGSWRFVFGCEMEETGELYLQKADGILGLGRDVLSLPTQLLSRASFGASDTFSLCFAAPHPVFGVPPSRPACSGRDPALAGGGGGSEQAAGGGATGAEGEDGGPEAGGGGELILGSVEELPGTVWVAWDPLSGHLPYYVVPVVGMRLGALPLQVPEHVWSSGPYGGAMLDSGTTFTYLPSPAFREFSRVLRQHVRHLPLVPGPDPRFKDICYLADSKEQGLPQGAPGSAQPGPCASGAEVRRARQQQGHRWRQALGNIFPTATLVLGDGQEVSLAPFNYLFQHKGRRGAYCLGVFENPDGGVLLGGILVRGMRVTYDRRRRRVGFAPHNCSTPPYRAPGASSQEGVWAFRVGVNRTGLALQSPSLVQSAQGAQELQQSSLLRAGLGDRASLGLEEGAVSVPSKKGLSQGPSLSQGPTFSQGAALSLAAGSTGKMQQSMALEPKWGNAWWHVLAQRAHPTGTLSELALTGEVSGVTSRQEPGASGVAAGLVGVGAEAAQSSPGVLGETEEAASTRRPHYSFLELPLPVGGWRNEASDGQGGVLETPSSSTLKLGLLRGSYLEANYSGHSQSLMEAPALHILALILAAPIVLLFAVLKPFHFVGRHLFSAWRPGLMPQLHQQAVPQQQQCLAAGIPPPAAWGQQGSQSRFLRTPPRPALGTSPRPLLSKKALTLSDG